MRTWPSDWAATVSSKLIRVICSSASLTLVFQFESDPCKGMEEQDRITSVQYQEIHQKSGRPVRQDMGSL